LRHFHPSASQQGTISSRLYVSTDKTGIRPFEITDCDSKIFQVTGPIRRVAAMLASQGFVVG
jgi:dienelactone hydrolase